jgi:hypothetical protein
MNSLIPSTPVARSFFVASRACDGDSISFKDVSMTPSTRKTVGGGSDPGGAKPSPVDRIAGPPASRDSMRSRSVRVFSQADERSKTLVKP